MSFKGDMPPCFVAQLEHPTHYDWVSEVSSFLMDFDEEINLSEIKDTYMSKDKYKDLDKKANTKRSIYFFAVMETETYIN